MRLADWFGKRVPRRSHDPLLLVSPRYDDVTEFTRSWCDEWEGSTKHAPVGPVDKRDGSLAFVHAVHRRRRMMLFAGHGASKGLLTACACGTGTVGGKHAWLIRTDDLSSDLTGCHIVAWACEAGLEFGERIADIPDTGFLGFDANLFMCIGNLSSEDLWKGLMVETFEIVSDQQFIVLEDGARLRERFRASHRRISHGSIRTGPYNRLNKMFLRHALRSVRVHTCPPS